MINALPIRIYKKAVKQIIERRSVLLENPPMPVISRFFGIVIAIYWNDHAPPHVHAKYSGGEAVIDIDTGEVLKGSLSKRSLSLVEEWRKLHIEELMQNWERARQHQSLRYIAPLE